jgi:hypothetical protein
VVEIYDPTTDKWSPGPPLLYPRSDFAAYTVNGYIYALGGDNGTPVSILECLQGGYSAAPLVTEGSSL